jgi:hypothetical protein
LSADPLTKSPFCNAVNALTTEVRPFKVLFNVPSFGFQILIVLSYDPLTKSPFDNVIKTKIPPE